MSGRENDAKAKFQSGAEMDDNLLREQAFRLLLRKGWRAGNSISLFSTAELMMAFRRAKINFSEACGYPGCGCPEVCDDQDREAARLTLSADATPSPAAEADLDLEVAKRAGVILREKQEAEAEVARLRTELAEWQEAKRKLEHQQYEHPWTVNDAARERMRAEAAEAENTRLRAREAELRDALGPFARFIRIFDRSTVRTKPDGAEMSGEEYVALVAPDNAIVLAMSHVSDGPDGRNYVTRGDLRRARALINDDPTPATDTKDQT